MTTKLSTAEAVLDALGGVGAVAILTGFSYSRVWNWRKRGFPAGTYALLVGELKQHGLCASPSLWKQVSKSDEP